VLGKKGLGGKRILRNSKKRDIGGGRKKSAVECDRKAAGICGEKIERNRDFQRGNVEWGRKSQGGG
jgi:hypothetical protein